MVITAVPSDSVHNLPSMGVVRDDSNKNLRLYKTPSGRKYPSVTSIIGKYEDTFWRYNWKKSLTQKLGSEYAAQQEMNRVSQFASGRGTEGHFAIESYLQGLPFSITERVEPFWNRMKEFIDRAIISPVEMEYGVYWEGNIDNSGDRCDLNHGLLCGYAGTLDCLALVNLNSLGLDGEAICLLDWKFFSKKKNTKDLLKYGLQGAAYMAALNLHDLCSWNLGLKVNQFLLVCANPTGLQIQYFSPDDLMFYWGEFRKMLACYFYDLEYKWSNLEKLSKPYKGQQLYLKETTLHCL